LEVAKNKGKYNNGVSFSEVSEIIFVGAKFRISYDLMLYMWRK